MTRNQSEPRNIELKCHRVFMADRSGLSWSITVAATDLLEAKAKALVLFPGRLIRGVVEVHPTEHHEFRNLVARKPLSFEEVTIHELHDAVERRQPVPEDRP